MKNNVFSLKVNIPSVQKFKEKYPQYGPFAQKDGSFIFDLIMSPSSFILARAATVFGFPAVLGVAELSYQAVTQDGSREFNGFMKQYIGAIVCALMEANGYVKTDTKKSVHHNKFTKGEFYRLG